MALDKKYVMGIDVGTTSVRAGLYHLYQTQLEHGHEHERMAVMTCTEKPIALYHHEMMYEQSSHAIWQAICEAVQELQLQLRQRDDVDFPSSSIAAVGFDATCSLVALGGRNDDLNCFEPVSISVATKTSVLASSTASSFDTERPTSEGEGKEKTKETCDQAYPLRNVVVWLDHRAVEFAHQINATQHAVLRLVGGQISPEMQLPKLLWLRQKLPQRWPGMKKLMDLADFLVYRATEVDVRSECTVICKWNYISKRSCALLGFSDAKHGWNDDFLNQISGEEKKDWLTRPWHQLGTSIQPIGTAVGNGLSKKAAQELGLTPGTVVSTGIIDAHAGGLACLGVHLPFGLSTEEKHAEIEKRLVIISGTSSCYMASARKPVHIPGVWGPYDSVMIPSMWLTEGGESTTGALLDHIIASHRASLELDSLATQQGVHKYDVLNQRLEQLRATQATTDLRSSVQFLAENVHVLPYFHGNRSPIGDPHLLGSICGLKLQSSIDDLAVVYLATMQSIACGARHIIDTLEVNGHPKIESIIMCGGLSKNKLFVQVHADFLSRSVLVPNTENAMTLGAAMLAATASGHYPTLLDAMCGMAPTATSTPPSSSLQSFVHKKYLVYTQMRMDQYKYASIMKQEAS